MYKHSSESIKESSRKMFISKEEKNRLNDYENTLLTKEDSYNKTETDERIKEISDLKYDNIEFDNGFLTIDNSINSYITDIEIFGNTVQNTEDLTIKSVGELQGDGVFKLSINTCSKNMLPLDGWVYKFVIHANDGNIVAADNAAYMEKYIRINSSTQYTISSALSVHKYIYFYDKDFNYLSFVKVIENNLTITTPENAEYFRFCVEKTEYYNNLEKLQLQVEEGDTVTYYEQNINSSIAINMNCQLESLDEVKDRLYYNKNKSKFCIDKYFKKFDKLETLDWVQYGSSNVPGLTGYYASFNDLEIVKSNHNHGFMSGYNITDVDVFPGYVSHNAKINDVFIGGTGCSYIKIATDITDINEFIKSIKGKVLTYYVKDPITIELSTQNNTSILKSYKSKTHIYSNETSVIPTIRCKITKSLQSSVQELVNTVDNIDNKLKCIENIKNEQKFVYETESGYLTCNNTIKSTVTDIELYGNTFDNKCLDGNLTYAMNVFVDKKNSFINIPNTKKFAELDVLCEGNTMVNLLVNSNVSVSHNVTTSNVSNQYNDYVFTQRLKTNTTYTFICTNLISTKTDRSFSGVGFIGYGENNQYDWVSELSYFDTYKAVYLITTKDYVPDKLRVVSFREQISTLSYSNCYLIEGDWTNKYIPNYFNGMMSVADNNTLNITTSKANPNLIRNSGFLNGIDSYKTHLQPTVTLETDDTAVSGKIIKISTVNPRSGLYQHTVVDKIQSSKYTVSGYCKGDLNKILQVSIERHKGINITLTDEWTKFELTSDLHPYNWNRVLIFYALEANTTFYLKDIKCEISDTATEYIPHVDESNYNTFVGNIDSGRSVTNKLINLSSPLNRINNNIKDYMYIENGQYKLKRMTKLITFNGTENWELYKTSSNDISVFWLDIEDQNIKQTAKCLSDKFMFSSFDSEYLSFEAIRGSTSHRKIMIGIKSTKLESIDAEGFRKWLQSNPVKVVYELNTPTVEILPNMFVNSKQGYTSISTNSLIPCNMVVKNKGYTLKKLKPNTDYTIKVRSLIGSYETCRIDVHYNGITKSTTNNTLIITTPDNIDDNVLRLTSDLTNSDNPDKILRVNDIIVIEGKHTDLSFSHFDGVASVSTDDCIEIISRSTKSNLFDKSKIVNGKVVVYPGEESYNNFATPHSDIDDWYISGFIPIKQGVYYIGGLQNSIQGVNNENMNIVNYSLYDINKKILSTASKNPALQNDKLIVNFPNARYFVTSIKKQDLDSFYIVENKTTYDKDLEIDSKKIMYINDDNEIEPIKHLRKWDKIYTDNGKTYYEKLSDEILLNGSESDWQSHSTNSTRTNTLLFYKKINARPTDIINDTREVVSSMFEYSGKSLDNFDEEGIYSSFNGTICISILKSRLYNSNLEGFKQWLQRNPITVVYQSIPKLYQCVNLDISTYKDYTTIIMSNTKNITPKLKFSINTHFGDMLFSYYNRVKNLENMVYNKLEIQNNLLLNSTYLSDRNTYDVEIMVMNFNSVYGLDYDLFELTKSVIEVGLNNYDSVEMEELIDFYTIIGKFNYDMADILFEIIENQINPPVIETPEDEVTILP